MDRNSQSIGICQRLINLIVGVIEEGPSRKRNGGAGTTNGPNGYLGSEIVVEFRHKDIGSGIWIDVENNTHEGSVLGSYERNVDCFANKDVPRGDDEPRPLLRVASDINKKSDEYIKSRKKAMIRNYSFDSENS